MTRRSGVEDASTKAKGKANADSGPRPEPEPEAERRSGRDPRKKQQVLPGEDEASAASATREAASPSRGSREKQLPPSEDIDDDTPAETAAPEPAPKKSALKKPTVDKKEKEAVAHSFDKRTRGFKSAEEAAAAAEAAAAKAAEKAERGPIQCVVPFHRTVACATLMITAGPSGLRLTAP